MKYCKCLEYLNDEKEISTLGKTKETIKEWCRYHRKIDKLFEKTERVYENGKLTRKKAQKILRKLHRYLNIVRDSIDQSTYEMLEFDLAGCTCPCMDNKERVGQNEKLYTIDCPYHGLEQFESMEDELEGA